MATTRCHQIHGGSCKNLVSVKNNFVCAASHGANKNVESLRFASLAKLPAKDKENLAEKYSTPPEILDLLAKEKSIIVLRNVASNISTKPSTLETLAESNDKIVKFAVANNPSASRDTFIKLAQRAISPNGFTKKKTIDELIHELDLADQYPNTFGNAYLFRLLELRQPDDQWHKKVKLLIGYCYRQYSNSEGRDDWQASKYMEKIRSLYPDDQELAEMVGY
jgi:hypothetical protein